MLLAGAIVGKAEAAPRPMFPLTQNYTPTERLPTTTDTPGDIIAVATAVAITAMDIMAMATAHIMAMATDVGATKTLAISPKAGPGSQGNVSQGFLLERPSEPTLHIWKVCAGSRWLR